MSNLENEQDLFISTKAPKAVEKGVKPEGWEISLPDPYGDKALSELAVEYGEDKVLNAAVSSFRIKFQSAVRSLAEAGKTDEEIRNIMSTWKPGTDLGLRTPADPKAAILKNFSSMTAEQRALIMQQLANMS